MHVDCFASLPDLTRKQKGDRALVMRILDKAGRFSIWDATEDDVIAATMEQICNSDMVETDHTCGFPWTTFRLTEAGRKVAYGTQ